MHFVQYTALFAHPVQSAFILCLPPAAGIGTKIVPGSFVHAPHLCFGAAFAALAFALPAADIGVVLSFLAGAAASGVAVAAAAVVVAAAAGGEGVEEGVGEVEAAALESDSLRFSLTASADDAGDPTLGLRCCESCSR